MTALRGIGNIPNTTQPPRLEHQREGRSAQLVRSDGEELGQRGERQYPPQHARPDPHRQAQHQAGSSVRERQHLVGPERELGKYDDGEPISVTSTRLPDGTAVAAETTQVWSRRRRPLTWQRALRATGPYWLLMPVLIAIVAILGYPLYQLVVLSFQQYGLAELIQHKGVWVGTANYASVLHDPVFWHTLAAHGRLHGRERRPDDRDRDVPRPAPRPRQLGRPDPAHRRASCSSGRCPSSSRCRSGTGSRTTRTGSSTTPSRGSTSATTSSTTGTRRPSRSSRW